MKIVSRTGIFLLVIFLNSIGIFGLSLKPLTGWRRIPKMSSSELNPPIRFYEDGHGLKRISGPVEVGIAGKFIVGVVRNGLLHPAYDAKQQRIIVRMRDNHPFHTNLSPAEEPTIRFRTARAVL
ncbi:uncharacterized protein LOC117180879 [Belonocnema kinseyi]|uniref:uncharacterized protein LOC117180879 n=1 Tax=Belonocnema kinseyi TaxID=2817044 RepID=UPI00143D2934|nr:uncharacterized protein LOC117180879 [Belonocnema kinseyi]